LKQITIMKKTANLEIELPPTAKPVVRMLANIGDGAFLTDCSIKMQEMVAAVHEHGTTGEITIKVKVSKTGAQTMALTSAVTNKVPTRRKLPVLLYSSENGGLTMHDPRQLDLNLDEQSTDAKTAS
jgi:hypothetical protein